MWNFPVGPACLQWQRQQQLQRRWFGLWLPAEPTQAQHALRGWWNMLRTAAALPFDIARHQHAESVRAGAMPRSLLESQRFEQQLGLMESLSLGPLARNL